MSNLFTPLGKTVIGVLVAALLSVATYAGTAIDNRITDAEKAAQEAKDKAADTDKANAILEERLSAANDKLDDLNEADKEQTKLLQQMYQMMQER